MSDITNPFVSIQDGLAPVQRVYPQQPFVDMNQTNVESTQVPSKPNNIDATNVATNNVQEEEIDVTTVEAELTENVTNETVTESKSESVEIPVDNYDKEKSEKQNEILKLRLAVGLSQTEFAKHFDIPIGTVRAWEQGHRNPQPYVVKMMVKILKYQKKLKNFNM